MVLKSLHGWSRRRNGTKGAATAVRTRVCVMYVTRREDSTCPNGRNKWHDAEGAPDRENHNVENQGRKQSDSLNITEDQDRVVPLREI